jgi:hypothetical protein
MAGIGADARRPWLGKRIGASVEAEAQKIEEEMVAVEGVIRFSIQSTFNGGISEERVTAHRVTS